VSHLARSWDAKTCPVLGYLSYAAVIVVGSDYSLVVNTLPHKQNETTNLPENEDGRDTTNQGAVATRCTSPKDVQ
jgi:hypothetical protein